MPIAYQYTSGVTERLGALGHIDTLGPNLSRLPYLMQTKRKVCLPFIQTLLQRVVGKGMEKYG